jgi:hypothetical protein
MAAVLTVAVCLLAACSDISGSDGGQFAVSQDGSDKVSTFDTQETAAEHASELAGFRVMAVHGLPAGMEVTGFKVAPEVDGVIMNTLVTVSGDDGGLLIDQMNSRAAGDLGTPLESNDPGQYFRLDVAGFVFYSLLTEQRTFTIQVATATPFSDDDALRILGEFAEEG